MPELQAVECPVCKRVRPHESPEVSYFRTEARELCACGALFERAGGRFLGTVSVTSTRGGPPVFRPAGTRARKFRYLGHGHYRLEKT